MRRLNSSSPALSAARRSACGRTRQVQLSVLEPISATTCSIITCQQLLPGHTAAASSAGRLLLAASSQTAPIPTHTHLEALLDLVRLHHLPPHLLLPPPPLLGRHPRPLSRQLRAQQVQQRLLLLAPRLLLLLLPLQDLVCPASGVTGKIKAQQQRIPM